MSDRMHSALPKAGAAQGIVVLAASVMPIMAIVSLIPVLPLLQREFGQVAGAAFLVPMALTIPALCVALFSPVAGWLSDRVGRKALLIGALLIYAASGIFPWFLDNLGQILAARVMLGVVEAVIMTVATALIGDYFDGERRENWIALQVAVGGVAATLLIVAGGFLGDAFGSRGPFLLYVFAVPIALAAAAILFEPVAQAPTDNASEAAFPYRAILPLIVTTLAVGLVFYTVNVKLGPILGLAGPVTPGTIGLVGAACNIAVGVGTFVFHKLKQHTGLLLLALGLTIAGTGYAGMALSISFQAIAAFAVLTFVGTGMLLTNMVAWTMFATPPSMRGRGMGMWTGAFFLGQFLAPLLVTAATRATNGLAGTLVAYALVIAAGAIAAGLLAGRPSSKPTCEASRKTLTD